MTSTWRLHFTFCFSIPFVSRITSTAVCSVRICAGSSVGKTVMCSKDALVNIYKERFMRHDFWKVLLNTSNERAKYIFGMHLLKARNSKRQSSLTSVSIPPRYMLVCAAGVKDSITAIAVRRSRIVYKFPCANCNAAYKPIIISPHTAPRFPKRL